MLFSKKVASEEFMGIISSSPHFAQYWFNVAESILKLVYSKTYISQVEVTRTKDYVLLNFFYIQKTGFPILFIVVRDWTLIHLESLKFSNRHHWSGRSKIISKLRIWYLFA
jgi:hypothetical protein